MIGGELGWAVKSSTAVLQLELELPHKKLAICDIFHSIFVNALTPYEHNVAQWDQI